MSEVRPRWALLALAVITLAGFWLRLPLVGRFPFREDEAIYAYWALHGLHQDPMFLKVWPDKPPLFIWLLQVAFTLWGSLPPASQMVNVLASTLTIPVLAVTARRWWGEAAAIAAALLAACSPFAISFGPTGFTDPVLVLAGSLAVALAARRRWLAAGLWLGVAIMTKQQGVLFAPLVIGAGLLGPGLPGQGKGKAGSWIAASLWLGLGLVVVAAPILYWDSLRWAVAPSPWDLGARNAAGAALAPAAEWASRAVGWQGLAGYLLDSLLLWAAYAVALVGAAVLAGRRRAPWRSWGPALLLAAWAVGFWALHVVTTVQVWDRYLLPLVVPLALLGGWAAAELWLAVQGMAWRWARPVGVGLAVGLAVAGLLLLAGPALRAAAGGIPIGGDHGAYAGLDAALAAASVPGSVLYQRELGWHAEYYLFDAMRSGAVDVRYYPSAAYLADHASKHANKRRFVVEPEWSPVRDLGLQLAARGLQAVERLRVGHFTVYEITERPTGDAGWRACRAGAGLVRRGEAGAMCVPEGKDAGG